MPHKYTIEQVNILFNLEINIVILKFCKKMLRLIITYLRNSIIA